MKYFVILILPLFFHSRITGQKLAYENTSGAVDTIPNNSILIVIGDVSCGLCFQKLNEIFAKLPSNLKVFVYYDSQILPQYSRRAKEIEIQKNLFDFSWETVFLPANSNTLLTTEFNFCDGLESPYILVHNASGYTNVFCHRDLFNTNKTNRRLRIELKGMLENNLH